MASKAQSGAKDNLTIVRAPHDEENPYFMFRRATAQDIRLSYTARAILGYLLSKPPRWKVKVKDLINKGTARDTGRDAVYKALAELERFRYLKPPERKQHAKTKRWVWSPYEVYEKPYSENPVTAPFPEIQDVEPCTENQDMESGKEPCPDIQDIIDNIESLKGENTDQRKDSRSRDESEKVASATNSDQAEPTPELPTIKRLTEHQEQVEIVKRLLEDNPLSQGKVAYSLAQKTLSRLKGKELQTNGLRNLAESQIPLAINALKARPLAGPELRGFLYYCTSGAAWLEMGPEALAEQVAEFRENGIGQQILTESTRPDVFDRLLYADQLDAIAKAEAATAQQEDYISPEELASLQSELKTMTFGGKK